MSPALRRSVLVACLLAVPALGATPAMARAAGPARRTAHLLRVSWMRGFAAPGTPARYNKVGVLEIGSRKARNVLVFEPGTSAGSAYIVPLAQWLTRVLPGWQVWSVERRENLLEDQSVLTRIKRGRATAKQVFDFYLGWTRDPTIRHHITIPSATAFPYAKRWGLNVAVQDLRVVIRAARRLGGKVVLSGHSLGGALVTAYATWNFGGRAGARDLAGLVFDDGASFRAPVSAARARSDLMSLMTPSASPWGGVSSGTAGAPFLGLFSTTGALAAVFQPNAPSLGAAVLPPALLPPVPLTNLALFAWNTNVTTSVLGRSDFAILAHLGTGISRHTVHGVHTWNAAGALTPPKRWATMLSGPGVLGADGVEWYFPLRLTIDTFDAIGNGLRNPAQRILGVHATMGRHLPRTLLMYAFGAAGGKAILDATVALAKQSHIPRHNLGLINRHATYAHNDPAGAFPHNAFFTGLVHFLKRVDGTP